jgi:hypothetical protein
MKEKEKLPFVCKIKKNQKEKEPLLQLFFYGIPE